MEKTIKNLEAKKNLLLEIKQLEEEIFGNTENVKKIGQAAVKYAKEYYNRTGINPFDI